MPSAPKGLSWRALSRAGGTAQPLHCAGTGSPPWGQEQPAGPMFPLEFLPFLFIFGTLQQPEPLYLPPLKVLLLQPRGLCGEPGRFSGVSGLLWNEISEK